MASAAAAALFCALRAGMWWPLSGAFGAGGTLWIARRASHAWLGIAALATAYAVALAGNIESLDLWAAPFAALLLLTAELAYTAAGEPDMESADPATRGRYLRTGAVAAIAGFGVAALMLAAASSGGSGGAEVTALGIACAAAALGLLAAVARRQPVT